MPRSFLPVSALALLVLVACGNSTSTTTGTTGTGTGTGGSGGGGPLTSCAQISSNDCFSNDDCASASDRCETKGTTDMPLACCVPGARGTGMVGAPCTKMEDCAAVCVDDGSGNNTFLCSKACTTDADCVTALPSCISLMQTGTGSFCGPAPN